MQIKELILPVVLITSGINGFNVETSNPILLTSGEGQPKGFFGFSVTLNKDHSYVGSPGVDSVYVCSFNGRNFNPQTSFCHLLSRDRSPNHRNWYGGSVLEMSNGRGLFCGPRTVHGKKAYVDMTRNTGKCNIYDPNGNRTSTYIEWKNGLMSQQTARRLRFITVMGNAAIINEDDSIVFGAPLARLNKFSWSAERMVGTILKFDPLINRLVGPRGDAPWTRVTRSTRKDPHRHDLTGSAVAKGKFFAVGDDHYVVGAPKANLMTGVVYLCPNCFTGDSVRSGAVVFEPNSLILAGTQFGERFGHSVCAVDLNGDGFDDVVVGAPLHSPMKGGYETGTIYIYKVILSNFITSIRLVKSHPKRRERGVSSLSFSRFGTALLNLGKLDEDEFEDFAVGAPYEDDGQGAVYIFRGDEHFDFDKDLPQRVSAKGLKFSQPKQPYGGFGYSFSNVHDVDGNGRPDFAVSAINSNDVVILRSRPTIAIKPKSFYIIPLKAVDPKDQDFRISVVAALDGPKAEKVEVEVLFENLDRRIRPPSSKKVRFDVGESRKNIDIRIAPVDDNFGVDLNNKIDIPEPINFVIKLNWTMFEGDNKNCPPNWGGSLLDCPLLDPQSNTKEELKFFVNLQSGCQDSNNCLCSLEVQKLESKTEIVVGKDKMIALPLVVLNRGSEPAFHTTIKLSSNQANFTVQKTKQMECDDNARCTFFPISSNGNRTASIKIYLRDVSWHSGFPENLDLNVKIASACKGQSPLELSQTYLMVHDYDITSGTIDGAGTNQYMFKDSNIPFYHWYKLQNNGPSPTDKEAIFKVYVPISEVLSVVEIKSSSGSIRSICDFDNPTSVSRFHGEGMPEIDNSVYVHNNVISCSMFSCYAFKCRIPKGFQRGSTMDIGIKMIFDPSAGKAIKSELSKESFHVWSHLGVIQEKFGHQQSLFSAKTEFYSSTSGRFEQLLANYWSIALGVLIVLLIVGTIIYSLYKTNNLGKVRIFKEQLDYEEQLMKANK